MEEWRKVEKNDWYEVSNLGNVRSVDRKMWCVPNNSYSLIKSKLLVPSTNNSKGYERVQLCKNGKKTTESVHRLVALAFIPNPENKPQVNHIDGIKTNNNVENLEWCTNQENREHKIRVLGPWEPVRGSKNHMSKLKEEDVFNIVKLLKTKTATDIAKLYNVAQTTITEIIARRSWAHLDLDIPAKKDRYCNRGKVKR